MNSIKSKSILFAMLLVLGLIGGIFSSIPALEYPDVLNNLQGTDNQFYIAVFFQALMAVAYTGIAVLLYQVIKQYTTESAIAYLGFRLTAAAFLYLGIATLLSILFLYTQFKTQTPAADSSIHVLAELVRLVRGWLNHGAMILPWSIGGILGYKALYISGLIPKPLSLWGIIASCLSALITILYLIDLVEITSIAYFAFNIPSAFLEITLILYMCIKGFDAKSIHS